jgi:hypothetical protein
LAVSKTKSPPTANTLVIESHYAINGR